VTPAYAFKRPLLADSSRSIRQQGPWKNIEDVEFATLTWVDWFNNRRIYEPIGNVPPAEKEIEYYQQLEESAMAA